jgi:hypothetical protein
MRPSAAWFSENTSIKRTQRLVLCEDFHGRFPFLKAAFSALKADQNPQKTRANPPKGIGDGQRGSWFSHGLLAQVFGIFGLLLCIENGRYL